VPGSSRSRFTSQHQRRGRPDKQPVPFYIVHTQTITGWHKSCRGGFVLLPSKPIMAASVPAYLPASILSTVLSGISGLPQFFPPVVREENVWDKWHGCVHGPDVLPVSKPTV